MRVDVTSTCVISSEFLDEENGEIQVSTVDAFQGQEKKVIIFNALRGVQRLELFHDERAFKCCANACAETRVYRRRFERDWERLLRFARHVDESEENTEWIPPSFAKHRRLYCV